MKEIILFLTFMSVLSYSLKGQETMIKTCSNCNKKNSDIATFVNSRSAIEAYEFIEFDIEKITQERVTFSFMEKSFFFKRKNISYRSIDNYVWKGESSQEGVSATISIMGNDIQGVIRHKLQMYRIETFKDNYIITKINQSNYPPELCDFHEDTKDHHNHDEPVIRQNFTNTSGKVYKSGTSFDCKLRVLVLYTNAAKSLSSNITNTIQLAVEETNQAFTNSNINREIELVYVGKTEYEEETTLDTDRDNTIADLTRFTEDGDGFMDEVHTLREQFNADICVLIQDVIRICGRARNIKALEDRAFCVVDWDCAVGNYTFGHEIGHLIGCRHDPFADSNILPREYGHGFINIEERWRTVMAVDRDCNLRGFTCTRLPYFSNPNVNYLGDPTGSVTDEDNARLIDEMYENVMSFRQPQNSIDLVEDNITDMEVIGDVIATTAIFNSNSVQVSQGQHLCLRSGQEIKLLNGFHANHGSNVLGTITNVEECGEPDGEEGNFGELEGDGYDESNEKVQSKLSQFGIYPNPVTHHTRLFYQIEGREAIQIFLYDNLGKMVKYSVSKVYLYFVLSELTLE